MDEENKKPTKERIAYKFQMTEPRQSPESKIIK